MRNEAVRYEGDSVHVLPLEHACTGDRLLYHAVCRGCGIHRKFGILLYVKQFNQARFFEEEGDSLKRFKEIMDLSIESGFVPATPSEVMESAELLENLSI